MPRIFLLRKKFSTKSGNISCMEEIFLKKWKFFFYGRNIIEREWFSGFVMQLSEKYAIFAPNKN